MPTKSGGSAADVDGDIEDGSMRYAHQLGLGVRRDLVMQTANRTCLGRMRMIVLYEAEWLQTGGQPSAFGVGLRKQSPRIPKPIRREYDDPGKLERLYVQNQDLFLASMGRRRDARNVTTSRGSVFFCRWDPVGRGGKRFMSPGVCSRGVARM